jgi:CheY-like chemotaxis protein
MFFANVSHDLRTPLNGIIGFSKLLEESDKDKRESLFTEYMGYIQQSGNYLLRMINGILDFSKIHAKKLFLEKSKFALNDTISDVISSLSFFAREKGIAVHFDSQKKFYINADEMRIKKVFYNLLSNAIKYTTDGKDVHISLYEEEDEILIRFKDTGIGISAGDSEKIFKPFEQVNKIKTEGTGLGLAIAKEITELHKGSITLKSVEGKGSEFTVHLPVTLITDHIEKKETAILEDSVFRNKKIMIVEDDKISRKFLTLYLQKYNMITIGLSTGKEVLERLKSDKFDLILMDIQLPDTVGTELIKKVKVMTTTDIPIIALTAYSSPQKKEEILASGFDAMCSKPVNSNLLLKTMYHFLRRPL